jgi:dienelactone hydrolase
MVLALGSAAVTARRAHAQTPNAAELDKGLYPAPGLPGGSQLEIRQSPTYWDIPDRDAIEFAERVSPYDPESWHSENVRLAERNEVKAAEFQASGRTVTAGEYYLRAVLYWRAGLVYLADSDPRMMSAYERMEANHTKAWSILPPPFERVDIPFEGVTLRGHFFPVRQVAGGRAPVVVNYGGADSILLNASPDGNSGPFRARGMSYLDFDAPGQGSSLRRRKLYSPPDCERVGKAVVDYLLTRPDVDPKRIAFQGASMGGYNAPRCATGDPRIAAVAVWSGAYALQQDIFDFYPPIQERLRWLIGARDLAETRRKMGEFTLAGRANRIECPLLVGYSKGDRVIDPKGALNLYNAATRSPNRSMVDGVGHGGRVFDRRNYLPDWFAIQLKSL